MSVVAALCFLVACGGDADDDCQPPESGKTREVYNRIGELGGVDVKFDSTLASRPIVLVQFGIWSVKDRDLETLVGDLRELRVLYLAMTFITDDGLCHVAKLPELRKL